MGPINMYLVICDAFTKFIEAIPILDKNSETVANALIKGWIYRNAPMETIVSDNGKEFKNHVMKSVTEAFSVKHRFTTPGHPQANGQCERNNRDIISYLKNYINDKTNNWEEFIPAFTYHHNTQWHSSSKYSPYFLRHGYQPMDLLQPVMSSQYNESWTNTMLKILDDAHTEVRKNLENAQQS